MPAIALPVFVDLSQCTAIGIGLDTPFAVLAVDMCRIGGDGCVDLVSRHKPVDYAREHLTLQFLAPDRPAVGVGAASSMEGKSNDQVWIEVLDLRPKFLADDKLHSRAHFE